MIKFKLSMGNIAVVCNSYEEVTKIAKPFVEKMVPVSITPIEVPKGSKNAEEEK